MGAQVIHFEVVGKDGPGLQSFYSDVFGWKLDTNNPGGYGMYRPGDGEGIGGGIGTAQDGGAGLSTAACQAALLLKPVAAANSGVR
jgi:hypothetical protein